MSYSNYSQRVPLTKWMLQLSTVQPCLRTIKVAKYQYHALFCGQWLRYSVHIVLSMGKRINAANNAALNSFALIGA